MDIFAKCRTDGGYFGMLRAAGDDFFVRPVLDPKPGRVMDYQGKSVVQWSINNYLGLAENEELRAVAVETARAYGPGAPMGSRMMTGSTPRHLALEKKFAAYMGKESAILFNYGYLGVLGTIQALCEPSDTILIDKLAHASMVDAMFMSRAQFRIWKHNDMNSLEGHLKRANRDRKGGVLIVAEGVYGMTGDVAPAADICLLKDKYDARLFMDDAHGFGVVGPTGRGTGELYGCQDKIDVYLGTFAKAFAAIGGVAGGPKEVVEWVRFNARTQVFAKSLPIIYVEVLSRALDFVADDHWRRERMWAVNRRLKDGLRELGYTVGDVPSPVTPVFVHMKDIRIAMAIIKAMREEGIFITGVMYPVVPKDIVLFRMIPTASHTDEDVVRTIAAYKKVRDDLNLDLEAVKTALDKGKAEVGKSEDSAEE
ncbi:MAG: aminotransferase class I/II-fold pyridoxal phosphate-dependent enzyme [Candidatus Aminicenantes bacterium]|nr:aminotransferase class I/II-fold pyridoxal phosphate-dependent enzyme [Candidatus Aminicenantes bacterium]